MNKHLMQLVELSKLDIQIDSFLPKIDEIKKDSVALEDKIKSFKQKNVVLSDEIKEINDKKVRVDNHIAQFSAKISEISKKSATVKTEKEANALKLEEEIAREQLDASNEEITRLEKLALSKEEEIKENNVEIESLSAKLAQAVEDQNEALKAIESERASVYAKKEKLSIEVDFKVLSFYEKIRKWAKNTAVVPVKKQACYGCFMQLNSKTFSAVVKSDELCTCPHCGRILYYEA